MHPSASVQQLAQEPSQHQQEHSFWSGAWGFAKNTIGIYLSFIALGYFQERVTRRPYNNNQYFDFPLFLVFFQCLSNAVYSLLALRFQQPTHHHQQHKITPIPLYWYAVISLSYVVATITSNTALLYINFPTQVLAKSCKIIPVLLLNVLIASKKYPLRTYVVVLLITSGISIFMFDQSHKHSKQQQHGQEHSFYGIILLCISLLMDGITNSVQTKMSSGIFGKKPSADELMLKMNLFATVYVGCALLYTNELQPAIAFCMQNVQVVYDIIITCLCMTIGQIFIFFLITNYGTLITSIVTTTRKFFTILISVIVYRHHVSTIQWIGIGMVFVALFWDIFVEASTKKKTSKKVE